MVERRAKCEVVVIAFSERLNAPVGWPLQKRAELGEPRENPDWWPLPPYRGRVWKVP